MIDPYGRKITYVRLSVTDRCDFRCTYCMAENMTFLPKPDLLTLEEIGRLAEVFIEKGVDKIRITGGEPLVRRDIMSLFQAIGRHCDTGRLKELTLTTNGSQLTRFSKDLYAAGVCRINISLDTLDEEKFARITRWGRLGQVLKGIDSALSAGLRIKINAVALKDLNDDEFDRMIEWCGELGMDLTLIETMPLGEIAEDRTDRYLPLSSVREDLAKRWTLVDSQYRTGGPSRYMTIGETGQKIGFITPLSHNFCAGCNRVRVTCTGTLYMCLGQDDAADLRTPLRASTCNDLLSGAIDEAIGRKPEGHDFLIDRAGAAPALARHMSVTGG